MSTIAPFLWFNDNKAAEAVDFYLGVFESGKKTTTVMSEVEPFQKGVPVTVVFELLGREFIAFNGVGARPEFNDAISLTVNCKDQAEIDHYWSALLAGGGSEIACGWLKDRFGLRWQVVPENMQAIIKSPGAMKAMMGMVKLDIAKLKEAGESK